MSGGIDKSVLIVEIDGKAMQVAMKPQYMNILCKQAEALSDDGSLKVVDISDWFKFQDEVDE